MGEPIEFFFFIGSTYTYLTVMRIESVAAAAGSRIFWRPFDVRSIMIEQNNVPFRGKPVKMAYMWRDIERRAARYGLPFSKAPPYPVDPENLANCVGTIAAEEGWCAAYAKATYQAWFLEGRAPGEQPHLEQILCALGQDPKRVIAGAETPDIREQYAATTEEARRRGIFGSPTFMVGDEIFWGDDRLEDAIEWSHAHAR
jgi:2-hydroxychromene-2-carboxylate isomerase